jgi:hypothetical protein
METSREVIFNSVRQGFAAAYDALVIDPLNQVRNTNSYPTPLPK